MEIAFDLVNRVRRWIDRLGQDTARELARLARSAGNAGEVAGVGSRMWALAKAGEDDRGIVAPTRQQLDESPLPLGIKRQMPKVLPEGSGDQHIVNTRHERRRRRSAGARPQGQMRIGKRTANGQNGGCTHEDITRVIEARRENPRSEEHTS